MLASARGWWQPRPSTGTARRGRLASLPGHGACSSRPSPFVAFQLEGQCAALHSDKCETTAENTKLKLTNQELAQELARTSRELQDAQQQLESLQQEACRLYQEKEM